MPAMPELSRRCLPIKLDSTSNGEFAPVPLDAAAQHARREAHQAIDEAANLGDQATADLYTEIARVADKRLWFLEAHRQDRA